ncbi:MAG: methionine--tRNA ligase [archaeon]
MKFIITSALPYVNYVPHLGHFVGCVLPADIYSRFLKKQGHKVIYVCGTDEYGSTSEIEALKRGISPQQLCDENHEIQKKCFLALGCEFDVFGRTTAKEHNKFTQDFYIQLKNNGFIYFKEIEQMFCEKCSRFLPDRFIIGKCPACGEEARGDQCEKCGKLLEPTELLEPKCAICNSTPVLKKTEHAFFALSKFGEQLYEWISKNEHWFQNARNFALNMLKEGLIDRDISRDIEWGVKMPDRKDKVFYSWFDAPLGYISFTKMIGKEQWWKDKNTKVVHFIGKDNIPFHTIFFPAMLMAHGEYTLPYQIASSEFLNFEGQKFSKSKRIGVFLPDAIELLPADYWRYYLIANAPDKRDTDFTWDDFAQKINSDLNDTLGNFVQRVLVLSKKASIRYIPDQKVVEKVEETYEKYLKEMQQIHLKAALNLVFDLLRFGNAYLSEKQPWKNPEVLDECVDSCLVILKATVVMLDPFLPETSKKIRNFLNFTSDDFKNGKVSIGEFSPLFRKITEKELETWKNRFGGKSMESSEYIELSDFEKIVLKVGIVKEAEKISGTKLIRLSVDTGEKIRTIVAGVPYEPQEIIGKNIIVVTNLKPKTIRGITSEGMLLAVEDSNGQVSILTTDKKVSAGLRVR